VFGSKFSRSTYVAEFPEVATKSSIIPYGYELTCGCSVATNTVLRQADDTLRLLFVGAVSERKGFSLLVSAMAELDDSRISLDVVGGVHDPAPVPLSTGNLPRGVAIHGSVSPEVLHRFYASADALVLPSMCEGFGRVLLEGLAHGLTVFATPTSGAPDILEALPDAPVNIVHERSVEAWADSIRAFDSSGVTRSAAAQRAARAFAPETYAKRWADLIENIIQ
jgi:glycosyltransferase involved in cell wall biosynthesis